MNAPRPIPNLRNKSWQDGVKKHPGKVYYQPEPSSWQRQKNAKNNLDVAQSREDGTLFKKLRLSAQGISHFLVHPKKHED